MRPVTKGKGASYAPAATVSWKRYNNEGNQTASYTALITVFNIKNYPDPLVRNVADCLLMVLKINLKVVKGPKAQPAKNAIMNKVSEVYKLASGPLVKAVGAFCAFCETSIPGLVEVEHVANKAMYPTYMVKWENFLPTCGPCNTAKGNKPDRDTVASWKPAIDANQLKDKPFYDRIRADYTWPDLDSDTYQFFPLDFQMSDDDGDTWESLSLADAANLKVNFLASSNLQQRKVWATLKHGRNVYQGVQVRVQVKPVDQDLVKLCQLNKNEASAGTYDRRAYNRTLAWFSALDILRPLMQIDDEEQFLQLWPLVHYASAAMGFWSLWVTLLSQFDDFEQPPKDLGYWLYSDPRAANFYPGTDKSNIVIPPRQ